ncbi:MAG TPA: hypothetical protein PLL78_13570 [Fimbriimonadaceae bacterium]|nr:hypothetical protein [Fimbriimonadaceae bacterium]HRJ97704.1 hypothetical protein [Fimbriimonadaceae bacterium]
MRRLRTLVFVVVLACLVACGGGGGRSSSLRMHVCGSASGPVFQALRDRYPIVQYRSTQLLRPGSLVVVDGATTPPAQLGGFEGIDRAFASGASVLILNATGAHKSALANASQRIGAYVNGDHSAYFITPIGKNGVDIVHAGPTTRRVKTHYSRLTDEGLLTGSPTEKVIRLDLNQASIQNFVTLVDQRLRGNMPRSRDSGTDPPSSVPRYIASITDSFIDNGNILPGQTLTQNVTFFFNVYENDGGPGKQFQWLSAYATGLSDPGSPSADDDRTRGYFQTSCEVSFSPDPNGNGELLNVFSYGPQASAESYEAYLAFPIEYDGGAQTYNYQLALPGPQQQSIPGWEVGPVSAEAPNGQALWFFQTDPYEIGDWHDGFSHGGLVLDWKVKDMNTTSITQFPLYCGVVFLTTFVTPTAIVMQYSVGSTYDRLHSHEKSPGIYDREHTPVTTEPGDPSSLTLLFGRAS